MAATPTDLASLIRDRQPVVVLTGAGISTESGIPDFRSPTGIWAEFDPLEYATASAFRRDPEKVWTFYAGRFAMLAGVEPNRAHRALARLEEAGLVDAVVTQNIDLLHRRAGSRDVVEVHGSVAVSTCPDCGLEHSLETVLEKIGADAEHAPHCDACLAILKPGIVLFEEMLPPEAIDRAYELARGAGLLLVVGTSLEVYPVAGLPRETLAAGGAVAVVNRDPTWVDDEATVVVRASAGDALAEAAARLLPDDEPVRVVAHDPEWAAEGEREAGRVADALGARRVEHIGSTAVPGLDGEAGPRPAGRARVGRVRRAGARCARWRRSATRRSASTGCRGRLFFRKGPSRARTTSTPSSSAATAVAAAPRRPRLPAGPSRRGGAPTPRRSGGVAAASGGERDAYVDAKGAYVGRARAARARVGRGERQE